LLYKAKDPKSTSTSPTARLPARRAAVGGGGAGLPWGRGGELVGVDHSVEEHERHHHAGKVRVVRKPNASEKRRQKRYAPLGHPQVHVPQARKQREKRRKPRGLPRPGGRWWGVGKLAHDLPSSSCWETRFSGVGFWGPVPKVARHSSNALARDSRATLWVWSSHVRACFSAHRKRLATAALP